MQIGVHCVRGFISHADCRTCVQNPLHPCSYPADVLEQMRVDYDDPDREPGVESFTPTRLLGCARQPVIMAGSDYYVDVDQAWPLVRGHMVHALMEHARYPQAVQVIREVRLSAQVETKYGEQTFTGKPDLVVVTRYEQFAPGEDEVAHVKIVDYKSTGEIGHDLTSAKIEHQLQVNMYAWLAEHSLGEHLSVDGARVVVDEIEIVYASMKKMRRFTSAGALQTKGKMTSRTPPAYATLDLDPLTLWRTQRVGAFIRRKIEERIDAGENLPPILEGDDAWRCGYCAVRDLCSRIGNRPGMATTEG